LPLLASISSCLLDPKLFYTCIIPTARDEHKIISIDTGMPKKVFGSRKVYVIVCFRGFTKMSKNIIVFSTPTCSWCVKVKQYLKSKGFTYKDVDVSKDERALRDMVKKTGQEGVPQLWINNQPIVGFDRDKINRLLEIKP